MNSNSSKPLLILLVVLLSGNFAYQAGLVSSAEAASPPQIQEVVRAKLIELVAPDGKVVGQLFTDEDGSANLRLRNGLGEVRVKLGAGKNGSGLVLLDNKTEPGVTLHARDDGGAATIVEGGKSRKVVAQ